MKIPSSVSNALKAVLGPEAVRDDPEVLAAHAVDGVQPGLAVFPDSTSKVSEVVRICRSEKLSLIPRGSGSKISAGLPPERFDLVLSTDRLDRVVDMDTANLTVTAEAGVRFKTVQKALAGEENRCYLPLEDPVTLSAEEICSDRENRGCFIPMTPPCARAATLGGIVAANSSGPTRLLHGLPRDLLLGVRYVTPTGEIVGMGGKTVKNVSGYDASKLMIGSRGSLGIVCEMTLRLLPLPERVGTELFAFETAGDACRFVDEVFETPLLPAAVELLNDRALALLAPEETGGSAFEGAGVAVALEGVEEAVTRMRNAFQGMGTAAGARAHQSLEEDDHDRFWERHGHLGETLAERRPDVVSVRGIYPVSGYRSLFGLLESPDAPLPLDVVSLFQAGSGTALIHFLPREGEEVNPNDFRTLLERVREACARMGGSLVVERATPSWKRAFPVWGADPDALFVMKRIKEQMDPDRLFCPGRFVGGI